MYSHSSIKSWPHSIIQQLNKNYEETNTFLRKFDPDHLEYNITSVFNTAIVYSATDESLIFAIINSIYPTLNDNLAIRTALKNNNWEIIKLLLHDPSVNNDVLL